MLATPHHRRPVRSPRAGFTLIEILAVIMIIAILLALLLPAINRVRVNARNTQVKVEIKALESACATFKAAYGMDPPSSLVLWETPSASNGWTSASPSPAAIDSRSKIRQIWPQFDFTLSRDLDGDGATTSIITLTQGECLVFFLGGVLQRPVAGNINVNVTSGGKTQRSACTGFSKNPFNPLATGGPRDVGIYEFDTSRFVDLDSDGFPEFKDMLTGQTAPYLYFSSYGGAGYRYNPASPLYEFSTTTVDPYFYPQQPYMQGSSAGATPWNSKTFQIISPGYDRKYGPFGVYSADSAASDLTGAREIEADNITNFGQGTLGGR